MYPMFPDFAINTNINVLVTFIALLVSFGTLGGVGLAFLNAMESWFNSLVEWDYSLPDKKITPIPINPNPTRNITHGLPVHDGEFDLEFLFNKMQQLADEADAVLEDSDDIELDEPIGFYDPICGFMPFYDHADGIVPEQSPLEAARAARAEAEALLERIEKRFPRTRNITVLTSARAALRGAWKWIDATRRDFRTKGVAKALCPSDHYVQCEPDVIDETLTIPVYYHAQCVDNGIGLPF